MNWFLGWTSDNQLYVESAAVDTYRQSKSAMAHCMVDLAMAPIGAVLPDPPIITPDGATYGYDYRLRLSDLLHSERRVLSCARSLTKFSGALRLKASGKIVPDGKTAEILQPVMSP
jgi:hypothetical protein